MIAPGLIEHAFSDRKVAVVITCELERRVPLRLIFGSGAPHDVFLTVRVPYANGWTLSLN